MTVHRCRCGHYINRHTYVGCTVGDCECGIDFVPQMLVVFHLAQEYTSREDKGENSSVEKELLFRAVRKFNEQIVN